MKSRDFGSILRTFANVLNAGGAPDARDRIQVFAAIFDIDPALNVSELAKRIASLPTSGYAGQPSLGDIARLLSALKDLLSKTAKAAVLTDLNSIEKLLPDRASMEIGAFVRMAAEAGAPRRPSVRRGAPAAQNDLVLQYKERLEASLGDEEKFTAVYNDLRSNTGMAKPEIVALAKEMTGSGARTEDAALKKIWSRHQSLMV